MGLGDFFGGQAKVSAPPPELRQLAKNNQGISNSLYDIFNTSADTAKSYAPKIQDLFSNASDSLIPAVDFSRRHFNDSRKRYRDLYEPGIAQTGEEILSAGSEDRQNYEATRARDDINSSSQALLDSLMRRRGRVGHGGGTPSESEVLGLAANAASGENTARYRERERGEAVRRGFFPMFVSQGDATVQRGQNPANLQRLQAMFQSSAANTLPELINRGASNVGRSSGAHSELASNQFGNLWSADNFVKQANAKRKSNMLETVFNVAGTAFGVPNAGGKLRGGTAGGGDGFDLNKLFSSFGGSGHPDGVGP